jgi:hypothetical protein
MLHLQLFLFYRCPEEDISFPVMLLQMAIFAVLFGPRVCEKHVDARTGHLT